MNYNRTLDIHIITKKLQLQYKEYYLYNEQCKLNSVEIGIRLTHKIRKCDIFKLSIFKYLSDVHY